MQVTQEPLDPCQVALTIEVETDKVVDAVSKAYREYAKFVNVPGFRKGKAPLSFVRQRVPESDVRQRAAEILVEPAYQEALRTQEIQPVASPKLELLQLEFADKPFIFKALVPLAPVVELGSYKGVEVDRKTAQVSDLDVTEQIEKLRDRSAEFPVAARAAAHGDLLIADVVARVEDMEQSDEPRPTMIEINDNNIPGFNEQVIGLSAGDAKTFVLEYPENYPEQTVAGKSAEFSVIVKEIREKIVPAVDDELAKKITNGKTETIEALRSDLKSDMERHTREAANAEAELALIDKIIENSSVKFPPQLVEAEVEGDVKDLLARLERENVTVEAYLQQTGKTQETLIEELKTNAEKRISIGLVLGKIFESEQLAVADEDRDAQIAQRAEQQRTSPAAIRAFLESNGGFEEIENRARTKKVLDFLTGSAIINDTTTSSEQTEAQASPEAAKEKPKAAKRTKTKVSDSE